MAVALNFEAPSLGRTASSPASMKAAILSSLATKRKVARLDYHTG